PAVPTDALPICVGPERLDGDVGAVGELSHAQLARGAPALWAVGHAVDHQAAGAADAFTAVAFKGDGLLALADQLFVELVEHFEEGHLRHDVVDGVLLETPGLIGASLSPD